MALKKLYSLIPSNHRKEVKKLSEQIIRHNRVVTHGVNRWGFIIDGDLSNAFYSTRAIARNTVTYKLGGAHMVKLHITVIGMK